jgi:hypothetical protein
LKDNKQHLINNIFCCIQDYFRIYANEKVKQDCTFLSG